MINATEERIQICGELEDVNAELAFVILAVRQAIYGDIKDKLSDIKINPEIEDAAEMMILNTVNKIVRRTLDVGMKLTGDKDEDKAILQRFKAEAEYRAKEEAIFDDRDF